MMSTDPGSTPTADTHAAPRVSIGLPVRNGANFVAQAIEAICRQTFGEFELIIADNASTDATEAICRGHATRDARIRYVRNPINLGAAENHRLVLALARAPFFKWQAHDDLLAPDFLARSVAELERQPDAVACITGAIRLDGEGRDVTRWLSPLRDTESVDPADRFGAVVRTFFCHWTELFSLMRRSAVEETSAIRPFRGGDIAFIAELALVGRFARIDDYLFIHRDHAARYYRAVDSDPKAVLAWYDPRRSERRVMHKWALYASHIAAVRRHRLTLAQRTRCYLHLLSSMLMWVNLKGLARDLTYAFDPRLVDLARALRHSVKSHLGLLADATHVRPLSAAAHRIVFLSKDDA